MNIHVEKLKRLTEKISLEFYHSFNSNIAIMPVFTMVNKISCFVLWKKLQGEESFSEEETNISTDK